MTQANNKDTSSYIINAKTHTHTPNTRYHDTSK